jgi:hypothetical protein
MGGEEGGEGGEGRGLEGRGAEGPRARGERRGWRVVVGNCGE